MSKDKKSTMGSDLDSYTRRKIAEIDEPRYAKLRKQLESSERPVGGTRLEPRSLKDGAKVMGYGALGAYGVGPATVVDGGINALNAAGDAVSTAKKEVRSRLEKGIPEAVEAIGKAGTKVKSAGARGLKEIKSAAQQFLKKDLSAKKPVRTKDAKSAASKDTEKKAKGGSVGSASRRADGCAIRGKTRGRMS
jgi:hypothetical protein